MKTRKNLLDKTIHHIFLALTLLLVAVPLTGCDPTMANRDVKPAEVEDAKARRIAEIDKLNIPQAQKDRMKAQVQGNPPTPGPQEQR